MKLSKADSKNHRCNQCGSYETHKDMYDDNICYSCYDYNEKRDNNN